MTRPRPVRLRRAAGVVFAAVAILPTLLFIYLLSRANLLQQPEVRLGVVMAAVVAVLGFVVLRLIVDQITRLARDLQGSVRGQVLPLSGEAKTMGMPTIGEVAEIGQVADALQHLLDDLRGATQRLEDLVFKLGTLNEMVELAARIPRIQDLLALVLQSTMRAVRATAGGIMILDSEGRTLRLAASRGGLPEAVARSEVPVGEGIPGTVVALGQPVLVDDLAGDPRFNPPGSPPHPPGSFLCMPIRVGDRVIGVINLARTNEAGSANAVRPQPFSAIDLQFLNALMTYIGYAVDNARLLQQAQQSAEQLQAVVDDLKATQTRLVRGETLRALGQLSSGVAHHLNNLFAVIIGRSELLLRAVQDTRLRRGLEIIHRSAQDGADVVRRVQRFSRVRPITEPVATDMNQLVEEVVELTRPHWRDGAQLKGAPIEVRVEPGAIPVVGGEPGSLREVLMNLLLNAVDAMPQGGTITIRTWVAGDRVHCAVSDTGVGMSEEVRNRALEPFFTTKGPQSTGLGLSIGYGTVQRHNGQLTIDSAEGQGATVTISLPVMAVKAVAPPAPPQAATPGVPLRILVIDDELPVRATLADLLQADGHTVVQASGGRQGIGYLEAGAPVDLVLTDLGMPEMTGWDVVRAVQNRWPELPVGLITGWGEQELSEEERGRVRFVLAKPFDHGALRESLAGVGRRS